MLLITKRGSVIFIQTFLAFLHKLMMVMIKEVLMF